MLDDVDVASGDQFAPLAELGARAPDLLAVQDPLVAIAIGAAAQRGQVTAGPRFGEQLATQIARGHESSDELFLLLLGAEQVDGRCDQAHGDAQGLVSGRRGEL